jgi:hypothetical protein
MKSLVIALCFIGFATANLATSSDNSVDTPCPPKDSFTSKIAEDCCSGDGSCLKGTTLIQFFLLDYKRNSRKLQIDASISKL